MGFSTSAAFAILGVCLVACIDIFSSSVLPAASELERSYRRLENRMVERLNTDIEITNITKTPGNPYNISIKVKNTGSVSLEVKDFTVIVNGSIEDFDYNTPYLYPESTVLLNVTNLTYVGEVRVKVVTGNGISDYETYNA